MLAQVHLLLDETCLPAQQMAVLFQGRPKVKIHAVTGELMASRAMVLDVIDIEPHLEYSVFQRRLHFG